MNSQKAYALASLRTALGGHLRDLEDEIALGTHERHLRRLGHLCEMVIRKMQDIGGATLETDGFWKRLEQLRAVVEHEAAKAKQNPVMRLVR